MESQIVRIVQKALANIREHAKAEAVRVMLQSDANGGQVLIEDDGIGFEGAPKEVGTGEHIGLSVMRERAARINGKLTVESDPSEGTRVRVVFPIGDARPWLQRAGPEVNGFPFAPALKAISGLSL